MVNVIERKGHLRSKVLSLKFLLTVEKSTAHKPTLLQTLIRQLDLVAGSSIFEKLFLNTISPQTIIIHQKS